MDNDVIDLDKLVPEPKKIKLSGEIIDLYPGKLKTILKLQRAFTEMQNGDEQGIEKVTNVLGELIPRIKDDDFDVPIASLSALVELAYKVSMPAQNQNLNEAKMAVSTEKKTQEPSNEQ